MIRHYYLFFIFFWLQISLMAQEGQLFLLAGQSNAVGQGDSLYSPVCNANKTFEFDAAANEFIRLKDPVGKPWKQFQIANTGSIVPSFANRLNELSEQKIFVITAARGGASCHLKAEMSNYDTWDVSGNLFAMAVEKTKMAETKSGCGLSGIIWMQGERDANAILNGQLTADEYETALENVIHRFSAAFGKKLPFYIILTAYQQDKPRTGCDLVRNVQVAMSKKLKRVYIAYNETGEFAQRKWFKDAVHYNQDALNDIGKKTAEFVQSKKRQNTSRIE
jgi:hypothetical protein